MGKRELEADRPLELSFSCAYLKRTGDKRGTVPWQKAKTLQPAQRRRVMESTDSMHGTRLPVTLNLRHGLTSCPTDGMAYLTSMKQLGVQKEA